MKLLFVFLFLFLNQMLLGLIAWAAPHPTTGGSVLNQLNSGSVFSQFGFTFKEVPSTWSLKELENAKPFKKALLKSGSAYLQITAEQTAKNIDLEKYVRRYLKDYHQFGFDISELKSFPEDPVTQTKKITVRVNQKNKKTASMQFFIQKNEKILTLSCVDQTDHFLKSSADCRQMIDNLQIL